LETQVHTRPVKTFTKMTQDPELAIDYYGNCLAAIQEGMAALARSNLEAATQLFNLALQLTQAAAREQADSLLPLTLCSMSLLVQREGRSEEATKLRERAIPLVDAISVVNQTVPFHNLMSNVLMGFHEYRRAIPFCEQAVQLVLERNEPLAIAELLSREGRCYTQCGLKEHAAVLLRAALKIFRNYPGDPRLSSVLISLANALRKSAPQEAEQLYQESADIHLAKAQIESATTAWVNLGILCSEQGRHAESLAHYERALRVREQSPATPPVRIATLLNNMANCYRRMGNFTEALRLVDRAIGILKPEDGPTIASAYGTRGQILHDAERDAEAVEWLRKSYAERQRASSPDLEAIAENLEREIESLKRLGKLQDALVAEERLASTKAALKEAPGASVDLSALTAQAEGAVMIELAFGSRPGGRYGIRDAEIVAEQLAAILESQDTGHYGGRAVIPESTTLMFYGVDAEVMFQVMEQFLLDHCIFSGAIIAIRESDKLREVVIPQTLN
jgi:tetratricopeptide (TPR) repeat protein